MSDRRHSRVAEELAHMAGEFIAREAANPSVSGLITVTRAELAEDYKNVTILFSVLPQTKEREALTLAKRARSGHNRVLATPKCTRLPYHDRANVLTRDERSQLLGKPRRIRDDVVREAHRPRLVRKGESDLLASIIHAEVSHRDSVCYHS